MYTLHGCFGENAVNEGIDFRRRVLKICYWTSEKRRTGNVSGTITALGVSPPDST